MHHQHPRWAPDSSALIYFTPSESPGEEGTLLGISALGGLPRPIIGALGGGDISHDGHRIALVQAHEGRTMLVTAARDGSDVQPVAPAPLGHLGGAPRWSPDDASIALHGCGTRRGMRTCSSSPRGAARAGRIVRGGFLRGASWLPDGAGLVYSSSAGSTMPYPPRSTCAS